MLEAKPQQRSHRDRILLLIISLSILILHSALVLQWSARQGRLALPVYFDDNHSMVDGARRLGIWQHDGPIAVLRDYIANPPHAPGHSLLAVSAFSLCGLEERAPYLTNILFLGFVLSALHLSLGRTPWYFAAGAMALLCATPIAGLAILEFRSEVNVAALGALGVILFLRWSEEDYRKALLILSAACFAGCLVIKPAVFPYTLGLMGLCLLFRLGGTMRFGITSPVRRHLVDAGLFLSVAILPALPHYLLDWHHITGYIGNIALSKDSVWLRHDDLLTGLLFHVTGYPGRIMLGAFLVPSALLILAALFLRLIRPDKWPADLPLLTLMFFTIGAYLGVAVNPMNQNYFGMTFHWLFLITAAVALCGLLRLLPAKLQSPAAILLGLLSILLFFGLKFPLSIDFYREKAKNSTVVFGWLQHSPELVMQPIREDHAHGGGTKVWITAYSMINARTLEWYSLKARESYQYRDYIECDWKAVPASLDWADYIILIEPDTPSLETIVPNATMASSMMDSISLDSRFREIKKIPSPDGKGGFRIYAKIRPKT